MTIGKNRWFSMAALLGVMILAVCAAKAQPASASTSTSATPSSVSGTLSIASPNAVNTAMFGQCGGAVHNGAELWAAWVRKGVQNTSTVRAILASAGWNEMDGSARNFVVQRAKAFQLSRPTWIEDFGCNQGSMFSVGKRLYGAGEWVIGIVPVQYSPSQVSATPCAGCKQVTVMIWLVGRGNCSNGFSGFVAVTMYVHTKTTPSVTPKPKPRPGGWTIWAYKWAWNGKAWVKGEHFVVRQYVGRKIARRWVIYSGQWNKLIGKGIRPQYLCEEVKPSSVYRPSNGKACARVFYSKRDRKWEVIFVNLVPKKPTPPGPGPGPGPTPPPPTPPTPPAPKDGAVGAGNGVPGSTGGAGAPGSPGSTTQPSECRDRNTGATRPGPAGSDGWCTDQSGTTTAPPTTGGTSSGGPPPPPPAQCIDPTTGQARPVATGETKDQFGYCYKP